MFLGIDVSTTATKAVLVDGNGSVMAAESEAYDYQTPQPQWAEQHPEVWWQATRSVLRGLDLRGVEAVGLTGQMHGLVLLGADDAPLRPAILWNDQRTAAECDEMRAALGLERLVAITGNDALPGFTAPKLLWVRNHEPDVYAAARRMLLPKDYLRLRLTGVHATDRAGGSGTQLFDLARRDWSAELLDQLGIDPGLLPPTFEGPEVTGTVSREAAESTGLAVGTPVVAGGGDQAATAVGTGVVDPGAVMLSLGTSGVVFAATDAPVRDPQGRVHAFCHALPERWHLMGVMLSAAGSLRWLRDTVAPGEDFAALAASAGDVPAGADGLLFLPYLTGERTPHADPLARGAFVGLTVRHGRAHLVRAVMEGVAFGLRDGLELMQAAGVGAVDEIRASGGGTRSAVWRQVLADVLGASLVTPAASEGAAYGAALLAAGRIPTFTASTQTDPSGTDYGTAYARYRDLYPALRSTFR